MHRWYGRGQAGAGHDPATAKTKRHRGDNHSALVRGQLAPRLLEQCQIARQGHCREDLTCLMRRVPGFLRVASRGKGSCVPEQHDAVFAVAAVVSAPESRGFRGRVHSLVGVTERELRLRDVERNPGQIRELLRCIFRSSVRAACSAWIDSATRPLASKMRPKSA